ncbi:sacsin-like [Eublepharis macularius]|uniref:Sacsin-like n=1 Tax=Eublepharis macularius TaxID=481883 RepID=A0AA97K565_EUBMA|nr:sacsin-like [Eublepharis macularius]XP_054849089.1 sacsin-like [Eublepharis macularius]
MSEKRVERKGFRQRSPPFLKYLQSILRKYPDGGQILKELVQNADDASAKDVILIYDERKFGTQRLFSEGLASAQGPALLAYNDGLFSEADWDGIQSPGLSHKVDDPSTVGRFGLGFNSVYHITDFPSMLSGQWLGVLDPQQTALHDGGQLWSMDEWEEASDQFEPFWAALKSLGRPYPPAKGYFPGTLFRFPLRHSPSEISENLYSPGRAQELLLAFLDDAPISLLFLRNIRRLTLGLIGSDGAVRELLRVEATAHSLNGPNVGPGIPCCVPKVAEGWLDRSGNASVLLHGSDNAKLDSAVSITTLALCGTGIGQATCRDWLVLSAVAKKEAFPELWDLVDSVSSEPTLSLAYPLQGGCAGRLSCVLPLPATEENATGLPLHISAPFQLTDDRRHVQWSEEGSRARSEDARWNHLLMEEMLPVAYCQVLYLASGYPSDPYGAWPDPDQSQQLRFKALVARICQRLMDMKLLVRVGDGDPRLLLPCESVLFPEKVVDKPVGRALEKALLLAGSQLVVAPPHVRRALNLGAKGRAEVQEATAGFVREILRKAAHIWSEIPDLEKLLLLEYVTEDGCYRALKGLPLVPMANGHFASFGDSAETVFVETHNFPRILLPGLDHQFLPKDLNPELWKRLQAIAEQELFGNLVTVNQLVVEQNICAALPKDWVGSNSTPVAWHPKESLKHPPLEWLAAFWTFLNRHVSSLVPFRGCPLIPLTSMHNHPNGIQLARLLPRPTLLFQSQNRLSLSAEVVGILQMLGCTVIQSWEPNWCHHQLREYILEPSPGSALKAFAHLGVSSVANRLALLSTHQIESLSTFLSGAASLSQEEREVLRELPLFIKLPSLLPPCMPALVPAGSHMALEKNLVPPVPKDLLTPQPMLLCHCEAERRLLLHLQVNLLGAPGLGILCVKAMKNGAYAGRAQEAEKVMLWVLHNADILFSQSQELQGLCRDLPFLDCGSGELARPGDLYDPDNHTLRALLRPHRFPSGPFREPVMLRALRALGLKSDLAAVSPADALMAAQDVNQLQEAAVASAKSQALIRVCNETPLLSRMSSRELEQLQCLAWVPAINPSVLVPANCFMAPEMLRSEKYAALVGLVMGLTNAFYPHAAKALGLEQSPPPEKVGENLACLAKDYIPEGTLVLISKLHSIYQHMQQHLSDFQKPPAGPAVWNGNGFSRPGDVVLGYPGGLDLAALIPRVPSDFQHYGQLFATWGIRRSPDEEEVCQALHKLADRINSQPHNSTQAELRLVVAALDWFRAQDYHGGMEMLVPMQIPGRAGFALHPVSSALYCDMDRSRLADLDGPPPALVHEAVPPATAVFFNVEMLSTRLSGLELFEAWGPSEAITLRIRNILREYCQDADVFQELLQNAEDAGAKTCHFLVDLRPHNGTMEGLLDPGMAACQGPALWAHNDAVFTEADFSNIIRLGAATKEHQHDKIGHFGLGFCTVYHMTDAPSILSSRTVLIFDPNVTHLQKHIRDPSRPGIRLKLSHQTAAMFPEQFRPFRGVFGCQIGEDYQGTLIRLPFRTEQEARDSEICSEPFGPKRIKALQTGFQEMYQHLLIFLHSVQEVSLTHFPGGSSSPEAAQPLATVIRQPLAKAGASDIVQVTASWESNVAVSHYLLHSCSGMGEALKLFQGGGKEGFSFSPPVASVALPLCPASTPGQWAPDLEGFEGRVFCFLPLPIESGLPLHLTAAFAVLSNRKGLWDTTEKGQWNRALLRDSVLGAWLGALCRLRDMCTAGLLERYEYYTFWPDVHHAKHPFSEAAQAFYQALVDGVDGEQPILLSDGDLWCSAQHACFLDADVIREKQLKPTATRVFSSLLPEPKMAVNLPHWVKLSFRASTSKDVLSPNTYNWARFLQELVLPNLAELAVSDRDALILHALDMKDASVDELLKSLPCVPATPDNQLKHIRGLVNPMGRVASLYAPEDGRFPMNAEFLKPERLFRLVELGMTQDQVAMEELINRARTVANLWHHEPRKACLRARHILHLLEDRLQESFSNTAQVVFREIPFLPAELPGNHHRLCCPNQIYHYKLQPLVGLIEPVLAKKFLDEGLKLSNELKEFLGLSRQPPVTTVLMQLEAASRGSNALNRTELAKMTQRCYAFLNEMVHKNAQCRLEVSQKAQTFPFVLVGSSFVPVRSVAHNLAVDSAPYLFQLPQEYQQQKELWNCIGISDTFKVEDYAAVLQTLAKKADGKSLSKGQLNLVIGLIAVGLVGALPEGQKLDSFVAQSISFPDTHKILHPLPKLFFDDTPWLPREKGVLFCHSMISREVALCCGIPTTRHHMLSRRQIQGFSQWATDFGAKEDLNTRLANILREYSSSSRDVLRELLQNADDAGASVVHFLWDQRHHPAHRVFGDEWKDLQGPALCIYNNRTFDMRDIEGIQRLGSGGKGGRRDTTGKYGLGFNTVYHLTDCPAFVTGDSALCVFDPTLCYLPHSDDVSPGGMFSLTKDFKDAFQDVYDTFLPEVFDLERGTVFRLPLRTPAGAAVSPICQRSVSEEDVSSMLTALTEEADCLMMFLNHVHRVVFSVIKENQTTPTEVFWVETKGGEPERLEYQKQFHQAAAAGGMDVGEPVRVFYRMKVNSSVSEISSDWLVGRQIGVDSLATVEGVHLPHGGVAACINGQPEGRAFCTLPLPVKTGLPIHINGNFNVDSGRRDLRKDDSKDSPEVVWNSFLLRDLVAPLYLHLLEELRKALGNPPLQFSSLNACQKTLHSDYLRHFLLVTDHVPPFWHQLVHHMYKLACKGRFSLVPVYQKKSNHRMEVVSVSWSVLRRGHPTKDPYFLQSKINGSLEDALQNLGMLLVPAFQCLQKIRDQCVKAGTDVLILDSPSLCCFLRSLPGLRLPCPLNQTPMKNSMGCSALLNFCLKGLLSKDARCLEGLPLLITSDGVLRHFSQQDPAYQSSAYGLFPRHKDRFSACCIDSPEASQLLVETGFMKEFTLSESAFYVQERLRLNDWVTGADKGRDWLRKVWAFFEMKICASGDEDTMNQMFQKLVSLFEGWRVLPVHGSGEDLVPLDSLNTVVLGLSGDVAEILCKLGFARLDLSLLPSHLTTQCIIQKLLQTDDPATVLVQLAAQPSLQWQALEQWEFERLLRFLSKDLQKLACDSGLLNKLKALPIFETHQGHHVPLASYQNMYLLQSKIPEKSKNFRELYEADKRTVLLKDSSLNRNLSECLGIVVMNDLQQFVRLLLPLLQSLSEARLLEAVKLLLTIEVHYPEYKDQKETVIAKFQSVAFIRDKQGVLRPASYFYDSSVDFFQKLGLDSRFVPDKFYKTVGSGNKPKVIRFLKDVGLRHEASEDDFLQFAVQIEREALKNGAMSPELPDKRKALLSHLLDKKSDSLSDAFLDQLSQIRFLAPRLICDNLCKLHSPFVSNNTAVAPQNSLCSWGKMELAWTAAVLLYPIPALDENTRAILTRLKVQCTLSAQLVLKNLSNVCQAQCNTPETRKTRADVLRLMYDYLMEHETIETEYANGLPVVLVDGDEVAEAQHVVVSLNNWNEFRPYLYRLPPKLAPYREFLEKFGVKVEPTIHHYASVLARIYQETMQKDTLQPNLIKTVRRATKCFFQLLATATETDDFSDLEELHLPCTDGKLYPSNTLVFNDCATGQPLQALQGTFHFLADLSDGYPSFENCYLRKLLLLLPVSLRLQRLSDITTEQLDDLSLELCSYGVHCEFQSRLKELLIAPEFHYALVALLRWQNTTKEGEKEAEVDGVCVGLFSLDQLEVICCEKVCTVMCHNSQCLEGSQEAKTVFVATMADGKQHIYLLHQERLDRRKAVKISDTLAEEVNKLLGERLCREAMRVLREVLACQEPEEIADVLNEHKVPLQKFGLRDAFILPDPGEEIPEEWHDSLDMSILHSFMPEDYVGYLDPSLQGEHYVYAVVLEDLGPRQSGVGQVHMYHVDVGGGQHLEVSAHDLYHFKRSKPASDTSKAVVSVPSSSDGAAAAGLSGGDWYQQPLSEVKKKVDACLAEIWGLSKEERKKAIRRLYLCYHPDKNLGQEVLANKIFKYLKEKIEEMENKGKLQGCGGQPKSSSSFNSSSCNFSKYWNEWDGQAHRHQERRQEFTRQRQSGRGGGNFTYNFWSFHASGTKGYRSKGPGMEEARRWLQQAECDLRAAANDVANASTEWLLYKTYRAVEKAFTAVEYKQGGHFDNNLSVAMLVGKVASHGQELATIRDHVTKLRKQGMDDKTTQYPRYHPLPTIPNEAFNTCKEREVLRLGQEILDTVRGWLGP